MDGRDGDVVLGKVRGNRRKDNRRQRVTHKPGS